jgi:hypothetical protein
LNERSEKSVLIGDRNKLIYTEATIMESLRIISSPIVPHVAAQDSTIDGEFDLWLSAFNGFLMWNFSFVMYRLRSQGRYINIPQQLRFEYVRVTVGDAGKV